jgi:hypothetical protein
MIGNRLRVSPILFLLMLGCGGGPDLGKPLTVQGKITLDGKPQDKITVAFIALGGLPAEHKSKSSATNAEGKYTFEKVYAAEYMVTLQDSAAPKVDPAMAPAEPKDASPLAKYSGDSPLRAKVSADKTTFDFELTTTP